MSGQFALRAPPSMYRRQPLLATSRRDFTLRGSGQQKITLAEVAGGTAAECAAVCCCCPCGLVNLLVLVACRLPAGLCRKALARKRRQRLIKKGVFPSPACGCHDKELKIHRISSHFAIDDGMGLDSDNDLIELEKEMWDKFYSAGFWRSFSQRSET